MLSINTLNFNAYLNLFQLAQITVSHVQRLEDVTQDSVMQHTHAELQMKNVTVRHRIIR